MPRELCSALEELARQARSYRGWFGVLLRQCAQSGQLFDAHRDPFAHRFGTLDKAPVTPPRLKPWTGYTPHPSVGASLPRELCSALEELARQARSYRGVVWGQGITAPMRAIWPDLRRSSGSLVHRFGALDKASVTPPRPQRWARYTPHPSVGASLPRELCSALEELARQARSYRGLGQGFTAPMRAIWPALRCSSGSLRPPIWRAR